MSLAVIFNDQMPHILYKMLTTPNIDKICVGYDDYHNASCSSSYKNLKHTWFRQNDKNEIWFETRDDDLIDFIQLTYLDFDKTKILSLITKPTTISEIIKTSKIQQTRAYRKTNQLIENGFLIPFGCCKPRNTQYEKVFSKIEMEVIDQDRYLRFMLNRNTLRHLIKRKREII